MMLMAGVGMFSITLGVNMKVLELYLLGVPFIGLSCTVGN